jgi:hypothetical protein
MPSLSYHPGAPVNSFQNWFVVWSKRVPERGAPGIILPLVSLIGMPLLSREA